MINHEMGSQGMISYEMSSHEMNQQEIIGQSIDNVNRFVKTDGYDKHGH